MTYLYSFLFCGLLCAVGQIILEKTRLTPGHITSIFVVVGALLDLFNIYDKIISKVGGGALVPITSFGHSLLHAGMLGIEENGIIGLFTGIFSLTTPGIVSAIFFSFVFSLIFNSRD